MRLAVLAFAVLLAPAALGQSTETRTHRFDAVGLTVTLPAGLAMQQALEAAGGDLVALTFVDEATGEAVAVEVHDELWFWQRAAWRSGRGRAARFNLEHISSVEPTPASSFGRDGGSAFRMRDPDAGWQGAVVQDCDGRRCLRISVTGPLGALSDARVAGLAAGVRLSD